MTVAEIASRRRRLGSLLYEALVILALAIFLFLLPLAVFSGVSHLMPGPGLLWLYLFTLLGVYFIWCWVKAGQTLAMKTWRLWIVDAQTSRRLRPAQALVRYGMAWLCWPTGLALLWSFLDPDGQFLHDRIAGSRIVYEPKPKD
ncbi:MAG: RDD family protein [Fluviibacter sp.]